MTSVAMAPSPAGRHLAAAVDERPALTVADLSHDFGPVEVLSRISLRVAAGEIVALIGPSGCGKTTLLNLCAGLLNMQSGRIDNPFVAQACMFQRPRLLPWKTALANIAIGLAARGMSRTRREERARALAHRLGLTDRDLERFPHQLSGGMQSRVALARALVIDPPLLLLDEPFSALDIGLKEELYALLLAHLAEHAPAALLVTHDLSEALRLSDQILAMAPEPGRIVGRFAIDMPRTGRNAAWVHHNTALLLTQPAIREAFALPSAAGAVTSASGSAQEEDPPEGLWRATSAASIRPLTPAPIVTHPRAGPRC